MLFLNPGSIQSRNAILLLSYPRQILDRLTRGWVLLFGFLGCLRWLGLGPCLGGLRHGTDDGRDLRPIVVFGNLVAVPFEEQRVGVIRIRLCDFQFAKAVASEMVVDIDEDHGPSVVNDVGSVDSLLDGVIQIGSEGIELLAKGLGKIWLVLAVLPIAPGDTITLGSD